MSGILLLLLRIALTAALYAFIACILVLLWRDFRRQSQLLAQRRFPALALTPDDGGEPRSFMITNIAIGRDPTSELAINDPTVSSNHARFSYHHNQWWLEDLQSTNGTFLNQEPVTVAVVIANGDHLRFGQVGMAVHLENPPQLS